MYDFDSVIDRRSSASLKWKRDYFGESAPDDIISMWIADSDYQTCPEVVEALIKRAEHGIFGYTYPDSDYLAAAVNWLKEHYGIDAKPEELCFTPGVVSAISIGIRAFSEKGDGVIFESPVYGPFFKAVDLNERQQQTIEAPADKAPSDEQLEAAVDVNSKILLLCNPHNPCGKPYGKEECEALAAFAERHGLIIISDDIHADFVYDKERYSPICLASPYAAEHTINCFAPSKTFNIAGLACSVIYIKNAELREAFKNEIAKTHLGVNLMGYEGMKAAYEKGARWLEEQLKHLKKNRDMLAEAVNKVKGLYCKVPDATFLLWIDCREFMRMHGIESQEDLHRAFVKAGLALNRGTDFGPKGEGFMRLNFACPSKVAEEAARRLARLEEIL